MPYCCAVSRRHERYQLWFPVTLDEGATDALAVSVNASVSGILLATTESFAEGTRVRITFQIDPPAGEKRTVEGTTVRVDPNENDPHGYWKHRVAIAFDEELPELETLLQDTIKRRSVLP